MCRWEIWAKAIHLNKVGGRAYWARRVGRELDERGSSRRLHLKYPADRVVGGVLGLVNGRLRWLAGLDRKPQLEGAAGALTGKGATAAVAVAAMVIVDGDLAGDEHSDDSSVELSVG